MSQKTLPVYSIGDFSYSGAGSDFYTNTFPTHLRQHHHFILAPHRHDFYVSVLFTKGSGTHEIDFNSYDIKPGSVFMIFPGQVHTWELSEDIDGYIFFHNRDFFDLYFTNERVKNYPFFSSLQNTPLILLKRIQIKKIEALYREIFEEYKDNQLMRFQKISCLVNILYIEMCRFYIPKKIREKQNLNYLMKLKELEDLLDKNFKAIKYPGKYATMMNVSERHLNRICKVCLNKTTSEIISERIILEAKRMLVFSKKSVSEIASELGYFENSYFFRLFRKKTGKTPLEFLSTFRKN